MLRLLSRFVGVWLIAGALVAGVVDGAKSIAGSSLVLTSLRDSWAGLTALLGEAGSGEAVAAPWPFDALLNWLLAAPTVAVLVLAGALLLAAGRRRRSAYLAHEYAA